MKKFIIIALLFISCSSNSFDFKPYKGYIVIDKHMDEWGDNYYLTIKDKTTVKDIKIPKSFYYSVYRVRDTIK